MTFEELIGSGLVFGIPGTRVTPEDVRLFKDTHAGGLILYRINFESAPQIRRLIDDLERALGRRLLVTVDHEGGRVVMFGEGVTIFPSPQALGRTGRTDWARQQGEIEGRELRRLGVDINFAPVADVLTEAFSPNIGIRSYGQDPSQVGAFAAARVQGMQSQGVSACVKHFPGLGAATLDPHLQLPRIEADWDTIHRTHLPPFLHTLAVGVHAVMTSHSLYPRLEGSPPLPATFSKKLVQDFLRKDLGFQGIIFSDDLEMGAVKALCPIGEAAVQAMLAGHDVLLSCHDRASQHQVFEALREAVRSKRLSTPLLEARWERIHNLQKTFPPHRFALSAASPFQAESETLQAQRLVQDICRRSVATLKPGPGLKHDLPLQVLFPKLSSLAPHILVEPPLMDESQAMETLLAGVGSQKTVQVYPLELSANDINSAVQVSERSPQTLLFLYDAHLFPSQKTLLEAVQKSASLLVVALLRDVYDQEWVHPGIRCLTNFGWRLCDLRAIAENLR